MMKRSAVFLLAILSLALAPGWAQSSLTAKETRRVLVLFSQEKGHRAHDLTEQGIREVFRSNPVFDVKLYIEYLDGARFSGPSHAAAVASFLRSKYAGHKIDAIVPSPSAIPFVGEGEYIDVYDGRELARGKIPDTAIPPGSAILFREPSLWALHPWGILAVLAVLAIQSVLIAGLFVQRSRRRSAERALRLQKEELSRANRQLQEEASERERIRADLQASREEYRWLAGNLLTSQEKEHRKFAHELHDDITQRLAALSIEAGMLEREFRDSPEPLGEKLKGIRKELMKLSGDIHSLSRQLHPSILDDLGLSEAMRIECARFSRHEGITVSYEPEVVPRDLPGNVKLCIYRVLQEGLRNVAKHAGATRARVRLAGEDGALRFTLEDNGVGFSPEGKGRYTGLGLISMRERVHLIGGDFSLESNSGKGTVIRVTVPAGSARDGN